MHKILISQLKRACFSFNQFLFEGTDKHLKNINKLLSMQADNILQDTDSLNGIK